MNTQLAADSERPSRTLSSGLLAGLAINTLPAWLAWKLLEDPEYDTVTRSGFDNWLLVVASAAGLTILAVGGAFRAKYRFALGLLLGIPLAAIAVTAGLMVDAFASAGN